MNAARNAGGPAVRVVPGTPALACHSRKEKSAESR